MERIKRFQDSYQNLMEFTNTVLPDHVKLSVTWKVHAVVVHLPKFLSKYEVGMAAFAEQTVEACHADFKRTQKRFAAQENHADHGSKVIRAVVEYNSRRL